LSRKIRAFNNMRANSSWWIVIICIVAACNQAPVSTEKFFDFEGLITDQVIQLNQSRGVLEKSVTMGLTATDSSYVPSLKGWESELEIFRDLEIINRPTYRDAYKVDDPLADATSNLKIRQYVSDNAPLHFVRFYYQSEFGNLKKIEAAFTEKNILYSTSRSLLMEFDDHGGEPQLIHYSMDGFQKMVLSDTVRFSVQGHINW
jgi:hypothetical protein